MATTVPVWMFENQYYGDYVSRMRCSPMCLLLYDEGPATVELGFRGLWDMVGDSGCLVRAAPALVASLGRYARPETWTNAVARKG